MYGNFDMIFDPFLTYHQLFTSLRAPCDVLYSVTMAIGTDRGPFAIL